MANQSISQFLLAIDEKRNQDMQMKLQAFAPYVNYMIANKKQEEEKQLKLTQTWDYLTGEAATRGWSPEDIAEFKAKHTDTPLEYLPDAFNTFNTARVTRNDLNKLGFTPGPDSDLTTMTTLQSAASEAMSMGDEAYKTFKSDVDEGIDPRVALANAKAIVARNNTQAELENYRQKRIIAEEVKQAYETPSGGSAGSGNTDADDAEGYNTVVNKTYTDHVKKVLVDGYVYVRGNSGATYKIRATIGKDGRLRSANKYSCPINPYGCISDKTVKDEMLSATATEYKEFGEIVEKKKKKEKSTTTQEEILKEVQSKEQKDAQYYIDNSYELK